MDNLREEIEERIFEFWTKNAHQWRDPEHEEHIIRQNLESLSYETLIKIYIEELDFENDYYLSEIDKCNKILLTLKKLKK